MEAPGAEAPRSSAEGVSRVEHRDADEGGEGVSPAHRGGVWGQPPPQKVFSIFELQKGEF